MLEVVEWCLSIVTPLAFEEWGRGLLIYLRGSLRSWLGRGKRTDFHYSDLWEFCCIDDQQWTAMLFTGIGTLRNLVTILSINYFI